MQSQLGVSQVALYKYVSGLDALKTLVAEEIFLRWLLPIPLRGDRADLKAYLTPFSLSMWDLVESHAGIAPYMLRRDMITEKMMAKIAAHQRLVADASRPGCCSRLPIIALQSQTPSSRSRRRKRPKQPRQVCRAAL
ncbi:MAG: hypothetical protein HOQ41_17990 [Ensifer adhaerens]|nr:hypothetical protein [Ensifer adhaerens]